MKALTGVPALAFAHWSHPPLFAPFRCIPPGHGIDSAPVQIVFAFRDEPMEGGPFPVTDSLDEFVLSRIPVTVIGTAFQVIFITNRVFPVTLLPDSTQATFRSRFGLRKLSAASVEPSLGEFLLDPHPAKRIAIITGRKGPDSVPMIWQQDDGNNFERMISLDLQD